MQTAFRYSTYGISTRRQAFFDAAVDLLLDHIPRTPGTTSHTGKWDECHIYVPHALALAVNFSKSQSTRSRLRSSPSWLELLHHATWFQYEIGDLTGCLEYLEIAKLAAPDQECFKYGQFCNTAACIWYELNNLVKCRENIEVTLRLYKDLVDEDSPYLATAYSNHGLCLFSERRYTESLHNFELAKTIHGKRGAAGAYMLGLNHMMVGRVFHVQGQHDVAHDHYQEARRVFIAAKQEEAWLMGSYAIHEPLLKT